MVIIALLRGVNVGGHHMVKMDELRAICESLGLGGPQTYLQSGNVIFRIRGKRSLSKLPDLIEASIEERYGFRPDVIIRTLPELRDVVARNPFAGRENIDPAKLLVLFLAQDPDPQAPAKLESIVAAEELRLSDRELYIYYPDGMGRSKLPQNLVAKALNTTGTGRNWNTVVTLLEMAERMDSKSMNSYN